jgi:phage gp45-like
VVNFYSEVRAIIREELRRLRAKALGMIRRGVLRSSKLTGAVQTAQVATLSDTVRDEVELFEPYGFTSAPPAGSEGVVLHPGGDTSHPIGLAFGSRSVRPTDLVAGEARVYATGPVTLEPGDGQMIRLGSPAATEFAVLGNALVTFINGLLAAGAAGTVEGTDGGAAAIAAMQGYATAELPNLLSERVQVE